MKYRKKILRIYGLAAAAMLAVAACGGAPEEGRAKAESGAADMLSAGNTEDLASEYTGIPIDRDKAEAVSIYYGSICYSYYSEERESIDRIADLFKGFTLKEAPDGELDSDTTYQIYFSTAEGQVAAVNVDRNGMFYLPEEKKFFRVDQGEFSFDALDRIYRDSMNADGYDENQCLIR